MTGIDPFETFVTGGFRAQAATDISVLHHQFIAHTLIGAELFCGTVWTTTTDSVNLHIGVTELGR